MEVLVENYLNLDYIDIGGLTYEQIQHQKNILIENHIKRVRSFSEYCMSEEALKLFNERYFFVKLSDKLVLCGAYNVHQKKDYFDECCSISHETFDYILYCNRLGFYRINNCSTPVYIGDIEKCTSPAIYHTDNFDGHFKLLEYKQIYSEDDFYSVRVKYNIRTYISVEFSVVDIYILQDFTEILTEKGVTLYGELPLEPDYITVCHEKNHLIPFVSAKLENIISAKSIPLLDSGGYHAIYKYDTILSEVVANVDNPDFSTSTNERFCFYISKNDTFAYYAIMKCVDLYGFKVRLQNLTVIDPSVNYKIEFPKTTPIDVISFIYGVISKSHAVYPVIFGCPIHDVVEILQGKTKLPVHKIDKISANNVLSILFRLYGNMEKWEIVLLLAKNYGSYAVSDQFRKDAMYFRGEGIKCDYLPYSMGDIIGEQINGHYVKKLARKKLEEKWISETMLYRLVYLFYQDAICHYMDDWLNKQHLDIYVPSINVAFEYQGEQHYKSNDYFGGELGFEERKY